ncbi:hypothetical protein SEA_MMASICARM_55 [Mycobacterium phage MmasiCarm]|nr:hypothetical protein SEA_MMASICARM_55 [Mycobacterium phage MmasiCarm]
MNRWKMAGRLLLVAAATAVLIVCAVGWSGRANATPDPYWPIPPVWCPGGGTMTSWGGYCDGTPYPDGTKWHMDSFVAPFVGRVWNPIVCVVHPAPAPPPLAPPTGCGRG